MDRTMIERLVLPEVRELMASGDLATLGEVLSGWPAADLASIVMALGEEEQAQVSRAPSGRAATETFEYLDLSVQERLLATFDDADAATLLEEMAPDDRTALLEELPGATSARLLRSSRRSSARSPSRCCSTPPRRSAA